MKDSDEIIVENCGGYKFVTVIISIMAGIGTMAFVGYSSLPKIFALTIGMVITSLVTALLIILYVDLTLCKLKLSSGRKSGRKK